MDSVVCTLFEGNYHYGVAALTNSLYKQGYSGTIYAGYKGQLPGWARGPEKNNILCEEELIMEVAVGLQLHFLPVNADAHLTNYKPNFILHLLNGPAKNAKNIYYFDPDIIVTTPWHFFEQWACAGICLCEDVNSPLSEFHPRRDAWRKYYQLNNVKLEFKHGVYVNGGFIGLNARDFNFVNHWLNVQEIMAPAIGGLNNSIFSNRPMEEYQESFNPFSRTDQDALNITIEVCGNNISYMGKEAMGFKPGVVLIPHSLGPFKPWHGGFLKRMIKGYPPKLVDREYWRMVNSVIVTHHAWLVLVNRLTITLGAFVGRFYRRG